MKIRLLLLEIIIICKLEIEHMYILKINVALFL